MFETVSQKKFGDCHTGRSCTVYHNAAVFFFLAGHTQTIDDTGQNNDGGSVLVIVKYWDIKLLSVIKFVAATTFPLINRSQSDLTFGGFCQVFFRKKIRNFLKKIKPYSLEKSRLWGLS